MSDRVWFMSYVETAADGSSRFGSSVSHVHPILMFTRDFEDNSDWLMNTTLLYYHEIDTDEFLSNTPDLRVYVNSVINNNEGEIS